ncbi:MAG: hypothetical protein LBJ59_03500 [Zoogloeaceae bacterium]|jgi:hypothetical protein|nr:hypothetical protein [Zoogloeaceae bacterium]
MTTTTTQDHPLPRSYFLEKDKLGMTQKAIYLCEASAANSAGDEEASWAWLALVNLSEHAMSILKIVCNDEFLKSKGFRI